MGLRLGMFNKILIANRGEIACRIIRTAKKMGIHTVAVYSTADVQSYHIKEADSAFLIGEPPAKDSYLNSSAIIAAAKTAGAQAIHPGYGFLSENADFGTACLQAGIIFIGPSIAAMQAMASKQSAKHLLQKTNVPLIPGYHGTNQQDEYLFTQAQKIGFPLLLKAASGGGGRGMRQVESESDFLSSLAAVRREAMSYFANDILIIEKLMLNSRHIEVQIMADNYGNIVHLFERDCSIQRRHQKIIEEAPAFNLPQALRDKLYAAACEVAHAIDYRGAGTVEFLVNEQGDFYFMEMNTRLQVEHPVTEMITGIDLVEWQLKIAANEPLPCSQTDISLQGHSIECRINAEDPSQDFLPSIGQIHFLREPQGEGIRLDSGVVEGSAISMYYDSMIAKLIVWGETRQQALQRLQNALEQYALGGVRTNLSFLQTICQDSYFQNGQISTAFLTQTTLNLPLPDTQKALVLAATYDYLQLNRTEEALLQASFAWQMHLSSQWVWSYQLSDKLVNLTIKPINHYQFQLILNNQQWTLSAQLESNLLTIDDGHQQYRTWVKEQQDKIICFLKTGPMVVQRYCFAQSSQLNVAEQQLTAPMPATIVAILKKVGDTVKKGNKLIVLEAMKMEHTVYAPRDGKVLELFYDLGAQVQEGVQLMTLQD